MANRMLVERSDNDEEGQEDRAAGENQMTSPSGLEVPDPIVPVCPSTVTTRFPPMTSAEVEVTSVTLFAAALIVSFTAMKE